MGKFPSPLLGYNNNVRHKGRVFHIQTEDSGINHPHIITHLFMDGGRILKSIKTSYAEHVGTDGMGDKVRGMMKDQHKAMFIALRDGQYDEVAFGKKLGSSQDALGGKAAAPSPAPSVPSVPESVSRLIADASPDLAEAAPASQRLLVHAPDSASAIQESSPKVMAKTELAMPVSKAELADEPPPSRRQPPRITDAPPTETDGQPRVFEQRRDDSSVEVVVGVAEVDLLEEGVGIPSIDEELRRPPSPPPARPAVAAAPPIPPHVPTTERRGPSAADLTLDFDALERDTEAGVRPMFHNDLPPPPKNLFATSRNEPGTGTYRTTEPLSRHGEPPTPTRAKPTTPSTAPVAPKPTPGDARYAPARPATIFGATAKQTQPASIFGDDLVSDKSLDEVILSYLAEDLDPPRRK